MAYFNIKTADQKKAIEDAKRKQGKGGNQGGRRGRGRRR